MQGKHYASVAAQLQQTNEKSSPTMEAYKPAVDILLCKLKFDHQGLQDSSENLLRKMCREEGSIVMLHSKGELEDTFCTASGSHWLSGCGSTTASVTRSAKLIVPLIATTMALFSLQNGTATKLNTQGGLSTNRTSAQVPVKC